MATRVALLTLVTGTFTALWSGDHPERLAAADLPQTGHLVQARTPLPGHRRRAARTTRPVTSRNLAAEAPSVPLPEGIVAGTYLVTDQAGRTQVKLVAAQDQSGFERCHLAKPEDHYVVERDGRRWHYIRLEDTVVTRFTRSPSTQHH